MKLVGTLERVVYANDDTGWAVVGLRLDEPEQGVTSVTCVGHLVPVRAGETLEVEGAWVEDRRFGRQFRVERFRPVLPTSKRDIVRYLSSVLVQGIGTKMAERIVEHFGTETMDIIDKAPARLSEVPGIGKKRTTQIVEAWGEHKGKRDTILFLSAHGVSTAYALRIIKAYGDDAVRKVRENPYRLAVDVHGIGFLSADRIAHEMGIAREAPQRAEAGLLYGLGQLADAGHVFAPRSVLLAKAKDILELPDPPLEQALDAVAQTGKVIMEAAEGEPAVYLDSLHEAETDAAMCVRALLAVDNRSASEAAAEVALEAYEARTNITLAEAQRRAVLASTRESFMVITGGPGTGKTTIIKAILSLAHAAQERVELAAPTGRAAKRMQETTGQAARTLHRLLEYNPQRRTFERNADNPLEADLLVVDEASMIDISLFSRLVSAIDQETRMIVVGDVDQLPSVGPGAVLADLIRSGPVPVFRLEHIYRQADTSLIVENAHRINQGAPPESREGGDFFFISRDSPEKILSTLRHLVSERIPRAFGLHPVDDIQVLTPMNKGPLGTVALNEALQLTLNPAGQSIERGKRKFRIGDKVMQVKNNYDLDVYNGDIGRVLHTDKNQKNLVVSFEGQRKTYDQNAMDELVLAYACSIHKSQGSEFRAVVLVLHTQHYVLLKRNLLYTAVTRGRELVIVLGSRRALSLAVAGDRLEQRYSRLAERLSL